MEHQNLASVATLMRILECSVKTALKGTAANERLTISDLSIFSVVSKQPGLTLGEIADIVGTDIDDVHSHVTQWNGYYLECKPHQKQKTMLAVYIASHWDYAVKDWVSKADETLADEKVSA